MMTRGRRDRPLSPPPSPLANGHAFTANGHNGHSMADQSEHELFMNAANQRMDGPIDSNRAQYRSAWSLSADQIGQLTPPPEPANQRSSSSLKANQNDRSTQGCQLPAGSSHLSPDGAAVDFARWPRPCQDSNDAMSRVEGSSKLGMLIFFYFEQSTNMDRPFLLIANRRDGFFRYF